MEQNDRAARGRPQKWRESAAQFALAASPLPLILLVALAIASPEFDPSWRMVSEYALGGYGWLLSALFASWGAATLALALALGGSVDGRRGRIGLACLVLAAIGQLMAAVFDIRNDALHSIAGLLGIAGLPVAATLLSRPLTSDGHEAAARLLPRLAQLTWTAVGLLIVSFAIMTAQLLDAYGGQLPQTAPAALPAGVFKLVGWTDRLIVVADCAWVAAAAAALLARTRVVRTRAMGAGVPFGATTGVDR